MKKITRILSVALVAVMVLSLSAVAVADTPSVYIPKKLAKLGDFFLEDYDFPTLKTHTTGLAVMKDANGEVVYSDYCKDPGTPTGMARVRSITEDSVMQFQFSEKPDWFSCSGSALDGGNFNIELDESGYGELEVGDLHRQPGAFPWADDGGFWAGKDYGTYSVSVSYYRDGTPYQVEVTLKDSEDFFRTNQVGGEMTITFERVTVETKCGPDVTVQNEDGTTTTKKKYDRFDTFWFVSGVSATYPAGNYIAGVETEWRNDSKQNLATYRIAYAVSDNETYKITYAPNTTTVVETHTYTPKGKTASIKYKSVAEYMGFKAGCEEYLPSEFLGEGDNEGELEFMHHYTADEVLYGEYYRNGSLVAVSGSGNRLSKWFKPGHGAQVKNVKKSCTSFKSPRVY